ncbi:MAG: hypothetical protein Q8R36_04885 [bacterium]|nr:hypothetical protein [bacterium]
MRTKKLLKRMPPIKSPKDIEPGDFFLDCLNHPCLCTEVYPNNGIYEPSIVAISLVDGNTRETSIQYDVPLRMTLRQATLWRLHGPRKGDILLPESFKKIWGYEPWWEKFKEKLESYDRRYS